MIHTAFMANWERCIYLCSNSAL